MQANLFAMEDPALATRKQALDIKRSGGVARVFFLLSLAYSFASLFIYGFAPQFQRFAFPMLRGLKVLPPFADLRWVTSISECGINLEDLGQGKVATCDPWNRGGLGYPPLSVEVARFLHVEEAHTGLLGFAIGVAILGILLGLLFQLNRPGWRRDLTGGLLIISFPMQLALERSNIDIIVFLLLTSLAAALAGSKRWLIPFAGGVAWLAVVIKLYPVAGITAWLGLSIFRRPRFDLARAASLLGTSIGFAMVLPWFLKYRGVAAQPPAGSISHGFIVPLPIDFLEDRAPLLGYVFQSIPQPLIGAVIFSVVLGCSMRVRLADQWEALISQQTDVYRRRFLYIMPSLLGCVWLGCYFLSGSFDYRLILVLPAFIAILSLQGYSEQENNASSRVLLWIVSLSGFTSFLLPLLRSSNLPYPKFVQLIIHGLSISSDLFLMPVVAGAISALILQSRGSGNFSKST
jgi:hypothetical protein